VTRVTAFDYDARAISLRKKSRQPLAERAHVALKVSWTAIWAWAAGVSGIPPP
jgi:hypothetical protein